MSTEKFITAIQYRPALWMHSHPHHKFRHVVKKLWVEIRILFPDYKDVKKKWKSLKDTYRKELKKIPVPRPCGEVKRWKYFNLMSFIKDEILPTDDDGNIIQDDSKDSGDDQDTLDTVAITSVTRNLKRTKQETDSITSQDSTQPAALKRDAIEFIEIQVDQPMHSPTASTSNSYSAPAKKRRTSANIKAEYVEMQKKKLRNMEMELSRNGSSSAQEQKSEDYHFLMSILPHIEQLPPIQKMRLRNKINKIVLEEMEVFSYEHQYTDTH